VRLHHPKLAVGTITGRQAGKRAAPQRGKDQACGLVSHLEVHALFANVCIATGILRLLFRSVCGSNGGSANWATDCGH